MINETLETLEPNENAHGIDLDRVCMKKKEIDGVTTKNEMRSEKIHEKIELLKTIGNSLVTPNLEAVKLIDRSVPKISFPKCKNISEFEPLDSEINLIKLS